MLRRASLLVASFVCASSLVAAEKDVYDLGDRRELFVDRQQIEAISGSARLVLHEPRPAEIAIKFDAPWEGATSAYVTVFQDGDVVRMYYRGSNGVGPDARAEHQYACYAESRDGGKTFIKPKLGVVEIDGSKENNVVWDDDHAHNFTPFKDTRPGVPDDERYKALQTKYLAKGKTGGLDALYSADGIHWRLPSTEPVMTKGAFDSQNLAFWDPNYQEYRSYIRIFSDKLRAVALTKSQDFVTWSDPEEVVLSGDEKHEHYYTSATVSYFRAPHYYLMFPKRLNYKRSGLQGFKGISDGLFMSSRDGLHFDRTFREAFIRPGRDPLNWGDRGTMTAYGVIQTGPDEMSVYYSQHYRHPTAHVRRGVLRLDGIASLHADANPGELITKPFTFKGKKLTLNYATSAVGSVQVEIQNADGSSIPGFTIKDAAETFGDKIDATYQWKLGDDVSSLSGKPVRLRFVLRDADVYSYSFAE